jgi:hypothetical protein
LIFLRIVSRIPAAAQFSSQRYAAPAALAKTYTTCSFLFDQSKLAAKRAAVQELTHPGQADSGM